MAIIFGLLLGIALLIGIYVFRSRCWLSSLPIHPGSLYFVRRLYPLMILLSPKTKALHPVLMSVANSARAHWTTEVSPSP